MKNLNKAKIISVLGLAFLFSALSIGSAMAQIRISGNVQDHAGNAMSGVTIVVEGTTTANITDLDGNYTIVVPNEASTLVYSFVGYLQAERVVGMQRTINVTLEQDATQIDEVVVTALGLLRKEKSLTYSTQVLGGDELTRAKDANMLNTLAGKTAGVTFNRSAVGVGGSAKVVIRGGRSLGGNNQPLYVVDGIPLGSTGGGTTSFNTIGGPNNDGNYDTGDDISNLNPEDIESMSILKGPSAAALYGTQAANGVILINTKKGAAGRTNISFSSNTTWDNAVYGRPEFQDSYGGTSSSWGQQKSRLSERFLQDRCYHDQLVGT